MHTHVSALTAAYVFLLVLLAGTVWRLGAGYAASRKGVVGELGKAAAFQF
jgi:hypothetical protein